MARPRPSRSSSRPPSSNRRKTILYQGVANDHSEYPRARRQVLTVADRRGPLGYQTNKRAHRIILRFDHGEGRIVVVLPRPATLAQGRPFPLLNTGLVRGP